MITIGEYLARTDIDRKGYPLTKLLIQKRVSEKALTVLPWGYSLIKPIMRPLYPQLIGRFRKVT